MEGITKTQDNDGHWYWIPNDRLKQFNEDLENITGIDYMINPDAFDKFEEDYGVFSTGGDPDLIPDYFKKTSEEWSKLDKSGIKILDPDGWDRKNWDFSWHQEKITESEFYNRKMMSTVEFKGNEGLFKQIEKVNTFDAEKKDNVFLADEVGRFGSIAKTTITIDESISLLEKAMEGVVSFDNGQDKTDFVLDIVLKYKEQIKKEYPYIF